MKHLIIPDCQTKPGVPLEHLTWAGKFIAAKRPDVIVCIGDFADMESLSSYDVGQKRFEGRRYKADIAASKKAMELLLSPFRGLKGYKPKMVMTLGNHEDRIDRCVESDPKLEGVLSLDDLGYEEQGWKVVPYLEPIIIDGVAYCHYFTSGVMGRPVTSAAALVSKKHQSCVMGHVQGRQIAYGTKADGRQITGLFVGGYYIHDESYLRWQGNKHWRGIWMLHQVKDGSFDEMPVSLDYLGMKFGGKKEGWFNG
jgi:hypothetical protein